MGKGVCPLLQQLLGFAFMVRFDFALFTCQVSRFAEKQGHQHPRLLVRDTRGSALGAVKLLPLPRRKRGRAEPSGVI